MRFVAVDIGNTSIEFALFQGKRIVKSTRLRTHRFTARDLNSALNSLQLRTDDAFVLASVVPAANKRLLSRLSKKHRCYLIGRDIAAPIKNLYRNPRQVGADRLMSATAIYCEYQRAGIGIDFGTAITFDVVTGNGEYLGGVIAPGIEISLEALFKKTALLPQIRLEHPKGVLGKDTIASIRSGCAYGIGGLCDRLVREIATACFAGKKPLVIATGGYASFMKRYCHSFHKIDPALVLKGIYYTYREFTQK